MNPGLLLLLAACVGDKPAPDTTPPEDTATVPTDTTPEDTSPDDTGPYDADGDGALDADDCDDTNSAVYPGAAEVCNGVDDDCDGLADEDLPTTPWFPDGDGYSAGGAAVEACGQPAGYGAGQGDCDDADPTAWPGADDPAHDGVDQDCDGVDVCDPGTLTPYIGDIGFGGSTPVEDIEAFCDAYDAIDGTLYLREFELPDLSALSCLRCVSGSFDLRTADNLVSLDGLDALEWVGGGMEIYDAPLLEDISALAQLREVDEGLTLDETPLLEDSSALEGIVHWPGYLAFVSTGITDVTWMRAATGADYLWFSNNPNLVDFAGLEGITAITGKYGYLVVINNDAMGTFHGLESLTSVDKLYVEGNSTLTDLSALYNLTSVGELDLFGNASLTQAEIDAFLAALGKENIQERVRSRNFGQLRRPCAARPSSCAAQDRLRRLRRPPPLATAHRRSRVRPPRAPGSRPRGSRYPPSPAGAA